MLHGEQLAGAGKAGLHFVGDHHDAVLVAQGAEGAHEIGGHLVEAALALHRLEDDGRDLARVDVGLEQAADRIERILRADAVQRDRCRHVIDAARERTEAGLVRHHLAGERHAHEGAAVEGARQRDHAGAAGMGARDLDGVLHGFGTGGEECRLLGMRAGRERVQALGQFDVRGVRHDLEGGVGEALELLAHGLHQARMAVAGVDHGDAGREVDVALAFHVPELGVLGVFRVAVGHDADAARCGGQAAGVPLGVELGVSGVHGVRASEKGAMRASVAAIGPVQ